MPALLGCIADDFTGATDLAGDPGHDCDRANERANESIHAHPIRVDGRAYEDAQDH